MKHAALLDEAELLRRVAAVLMRDLGPVETARFMAMLPPPRIDSVKRHRAWQAKLDKDTFFAQVFPSKSRR